MKRQTLIALSIAFIMLAGCCKPKSKGQPVTPQQQYGVTDKFDMNTLPCGIVVGGESTQGYDIGQLTIQSDSANAVISVSVPMYVWDAVKKGAANRQLLVRHVEQPA